MDKTAKRLFRGSGVRQLIIVILVVIAAVVAVNSFRRNSPSADVQSISIMKITVNDEVGVPLSQATVKVVSHQTDETHTIAQKDDQGFFVARVRPGTYTLEAESPGYTSDSQPTTVEAGQTQELLFYLRRP